MTTQLATRKILQICVSLSQGTFCLLRIFQVHRDDPIFTLQTTDHPERNRLAYVVKKDDDNVVTVSLKGWIHTWSLSTGQHTRSFQSNNTARVGGIALCNNILRCTHSDNTHQGGLLVWVLHEKDGQYTQSDSTMLNVARCSHATTNFKGTSCESLASVAARRFASN